ncbi:MAG: AI-2E family transporter [Acidobacteriota bacterium]
MKAVRAAAWLVIAYLAVHILVVVQDLLIPLVLAIFFWFLITNLRLFLGRLELAGRRLPTWASFVAALALIVLAALALVDLVETNVSRVAEEGQVYQRNAEARIAEIFDGLGLDEPPALPELMNRVDLEVVVSRSATAIASILGNAGLVAAYLLFLFVEERYFDRKLDALFPDPTRRGEMRRLFTKIGEDTRAYIGLKTLVSLMTAVPSWLILVLVGLDYAEFWALLIFVFNFVPNIGSLVATLLPAALALVQFDSLQPFFIVAGGVMAMQLGVANLIEPKIMGRSLNLSPLVIILSLVVWGKAWGIAGMFLCVPIMVVLMIVFGHFDSTRWLAVLLSEDGQLSSDESDEDSLADTIEVIPQVSR